ncbi:MAG TPA: Asp-tRNA(Asn)/Glu-tRNA(Gln) amidotransferase subunit GatA [Candidatus Atribacteria bacterium]|nr:Asp-tRNA(Asn)/Glu-tRNA(Gln) amidotransferase subunit GatA [Candidatus Atribacteria bacterium]
MKIEEFKDFTIQDYHHLLEEKKISPLELIDIFLERIEEGEDKIHAFLFVNEEEAKNEAQEKTDNWPEELPPLWGLPVAIKDNICTQGMPTTCGSKMLENFVSPYDATVVERLKAAGAIILGKTNMDEFAMGSSTENSTFGPTHNPLDLRRTPGGSSGGSAASVCALEAPCALGSDTGGSVRQPAAFCGVVGLRPTYGRVPRYGVVGLASSLDQAGPITRKVEDAITILEVISGKDSRDSTCAPYPPFSRNEIPSLEDIRKIKVGVPREYFSSRVEKVIGEKIQEALGKLKGEGVELVEVSLPHTDYALEAYHIVASAEASSNLARYDGVMYGLRVEGEDLQDMYFETRTLGFGKEVKRRIILGTYSLSSGHYDEYYLKSMKVRTLVRKDFEEALKQCNLLITPTTPSFPFFLGEETQDLYERYTDDIFTIPSALAGLPSLSLNCGYEGGLPVGLQIIGGPFEEGKLLGLALWLEKLLALPSPFPELKEGRGQ